MSKSKVADFFAYGDALKGLWRLVENSSHYNVKMRKQRFYELLREAGNEFHWHIQDAIQWRDDATFHFSENKFLTAIIVFAYQLHDGVWMNTLSCEGLYREGVRTDYEGLILCLGYDIFTQDVHNTHNNLLEATHETLVWLKDNGYEKETKELLVNSWALISWFWALNPELLAENRKQFAPYYF